MTESASPLSQGRIPPRMHRDVGPVDTRYSPSPIWPFVVMIYASMMPQEIRIVLGEQTLYPVRIALFALTPWFARRAASGAVRLHRADWMMMATGLWILLSFVIFYGIWPGIPRGFALAFDVVAPFFVARLCIRSLDDFRRALIYIAPGAAVAGALVAYESLSGTHVVRATFSSIFGYLSKYENGVAIGLQTLDDYVRLGLMRAEGPFSHPILGGIFFSSMLPLYALSGIRGWPRIVGLFASLCAVFSVSSAAFLVFLIAMLLIGYEIFQQRFAFFGWAIAIGLVILGALTLELVSENGIVPIFIRYTLDPWTAAYRVLIWEYGSASVWKHPIIGIGFRDFERLPWMGTSVDNNWLLVAIRHGLPAIILTLAAIATAIGTMSVAIGGLRGRDRLFAVALAASFFALFVAGISVAFFGGFPAWFYGLQGSLVGIGSLAIENAARQAPRVIARPKPLPINGPPISDGPVRSVR